MKSLNLVLSLVCVVGLIFYSSCGSDDGGDLGLTNQEITTALLTKTWDITNSGTITRDNVNITTDFSNFVLTFTASGYTSTGGGDLWSSSGTWSYTSTDPTDNSSITIGTIDISIAVSQSSLTMNFTVPDGSNGIGFRTSGVDGNYQITLNQP